MVSTRRQGKINTPNDFTTAFGVLIGQNYRDTNTDGTVDCDNVYTENFVDNKQQQEDCDVYDFQYCHGDSADAVDVNDPIIHTMFEFSDNAISAVNGKLMIDSQNTPLQRNRTGRILTSLRLEYESPSFPEHHNFYSKLKDYLSEIEVRLFPKVSLLQECESSYSILGIKIFLISHPFLLIYCNDGLVC